MREIINNANNEGFEKKCGIEFVAFKYPPLFHVIKKYKHTRDCYWVYIYNDGKLAFEKKCGTAFVAFKYRICFTLLKNENLS